MKKNINILFCFIFSNTFMGVNKDEIAKYKKENQKKSSKVASGGILKDGNEKFNKSSKNLSVTNLKLKEDSKELDKKNNSKKKNNYQDPFGGLDENLFDSVGKTKIKSEEKQKNSDNKKIIKKNAEEKNEKKDNSILSSIKSFFKGTAKTIAKSDIGKQVGGVLKEASVSVVANAIDAGKEKLNQEVISLNNKISGQDNNNQIRAKTELEIEPSPKIETQIKNDELKNDIKYEDPFEGLDERLYKSLDSNIDKDEDKNFDKEDDKKLDKVNDSNLSVNSQIVKKDTVLPVSASFVSSFGFKSKKKSKNKARSKKNK